MPIDYELIKGADNGSSPDILREMYPKINRNFDKTKQELDHQDERITNLTQGGGPDKDLELVDARLPASGPAYPTLRDRLNQSDADLDAQKADVAQRFNETAKQISIRSLIPDVAVRTIGHRGSMSFAPQNTIPSFEMAAHMGYKIMEADVRVTSDDEPICFHDATVDATTDGTGTVSAMTWADISELTVTAGSNIAMYPGLKIPKLSEFLAVCRKHNVIPFIDCKFDSSKYNAVYDVIVSSGFEGRVLLLCEADKAVVIRQIENSNPLVIYYGTINEANILEAAAVGGSGVNYPKAQHSTEISEKCKENGLLSILSIVYNWVEINNYSNLGADLFFAEGIV